MSSDFIPPLIPASCDSSSSGPDAEISSMEVRIVFVPFPIAPVGPASCPIPAAAQSWPVTYGIEDRVEQRPPYRHTAAASDELKSHGDVVSWRCVECLACPLCGPELLVSFARGDCRRCDVEVSSVARAFGIPVSATLLRPAPFGGRSGL